MIEPLPLAARRIVVTRAAAQGAPFIDRLRELGATPIIAPAIRILPPDDPAPLIEAVESLDGFGWLVCTSANGVRALVGARGPSASAFPWPIGLRIAAVGPATAIAFRDAGAAVHFTPSAALAEALGRELPLEPGRGSRVLWPRGDLASAALTHALEARGAQVVAPVAYRTVSDVGLLGLVDALRDGRVDAITFTSASTVRHVVEGLAIAGLRLEQVDPRDRPLVACIGPVAAAAARECGLTVDAIADPHDDEGLVAALIRSFSGRTTPA